MKTNASTIILVFLLVCNLVAFNEIDNFNVLLPTAYHPSNGHAKQLITTSGGCYQWQSAYDQIISVIGVSPDSTNCNPYGIVEVKKQGPYQNSILLSITDQSNQQNKIIPVRIRDLNKIAIFTKAKTMNIKEIQNLQIYGFDSENNTFTSLEGLTFKWQIVNEDGQLLKIPLNEASLYMHLDTRKKLQLRGQESDILVVRALKVGTVRIRARCLEEQYSLIQDQIIIYIQEKFEIFPSEPVTILAGSSYVFYLKNPSGKNITLPAPQYLITVDNGFMITDQMKLTAPSYKSQTFLNVSDRRTTPSFSSSVSINCLEPNRIQIICPQQIIIGRTIKYKLQFYHDNYLLKGVPAKIDIRSSDGFILDEKQRIISANTKRSGEITVNFNGVVATKQITSVTPVSVILPNEGLLVLPVGEVYQLRTIGGSGLYRYEIDSRQLAKISYNGIITTKSEGQATLKVFDQKNPNNYANINLIIASLAKISNIQQNKQSNINQLSNLFISAVPRTSKQPFYTQCNDAIKKLLLRSTLSTGVFEIISVYGASGETLFQLKNQANTNPNLMKALNEQSVLSVPKDEFKKKYSIHVRENDITEPQLNQIVQDMENYGICSKLMYKGLIPYDDKAVIVFNDADPISLHVRIYPELRTKIKKDEKDPYSWVTNYNIANNRKQIIMTPSSSFRWETQGGSYAWDAPTQILLNGVKLSKDHFPLISCPDSPEASVNKYLIQFRNPSTNRVLRPVTQDQQLTIICEIPSKIRTSLLSKMPSPSDASLTSYLYKPNKQIYTHPAIFLHPKQNFYILIEPLTKNGAPFYNSSNTLYQIKSLKSDKLADIRINHVGKNYKLAEYSTLKRSPQDQTSDDQLFIKAIANDKVVYTSQQERTLGPQLREQFLIKILDQLKIILEEVESGELIMPNHPSGTRVVRISQADRPFRIKSYDESLVTAWRDHENNIKIQPKGASGRTIVQVIDDLVIGSPKIQLPVRVFEPSGIKMRIDSVTKKKRQSATNTKTWVIEGEQIVLGLQVYSVDRNNSNYMIIKDINPDDITVNFETQPMNNPELRQLQRYFDKNSQEIMIKYATPSFTKNLDYSRINSRQKKEGLIYTIKGKLNKYPMISNDVQLSIFRPITIKGGQPLLSKNPQGLDFQISIVNSCKKQIQILGGPPELKTMVISNIGQNYHHKISKIKETVYQIEALRTIQKQDKSIHDINRKQITGNQNNLVIIAIKFDGYQLGSPRFLINVEEIGHFGITGLSKMISGKETRLLAEADNIAMINAFACEFKFVWKNAGDVVMITSSNYKNGVNITALKEGDSTIELTVTNQNNKQLGRATKRIQVVNEFQYKPLIKSEQNLILLPPNSAIQFPQTTKVQQISPCDEQNSEITILGSNQIRSGSRVSEQAQIIKISSFSNPSEIPSYFSLLVTKICAIAVQNDYGTISVHRDIPAQLPYYLMDCYGRKFRHRLLNIEYRVTVADHEIARAQINSASNTIMIQGNKIGNTMLLLEVISQEDVIKDIVPISVKIFIEPSKAINVHIGDQITFKATTQQHEAEWQTSNSKGLPILKSTGQATAQLDGEYSIKFANMETKVSVTRLSDILKSQTPYIYVPVYSNQKQLSSHSSIVRNLKWHCQIVGSESHYFTANAKHQINSETNTEQILCQIQRTSTPAPKQFANMIEIKVVGRVKSKFEYYRTFVEPLKAEQFFLIVTDRKIEAASHTGLYYVIVQTKQKLEVYQKGGQNRWISKNQFNGAKQVITLDFTQKQSIKVPWELHIFNPKTLQRQVIQISQNSEKQEENEKTPAEKDNGEWKWTDILVFVMGLNFIVICLYQMMCNNRNPAHYHEY